MFPGEVVVLMSVAFSRGSSCSKLVDRSTIATSKYIDYLYNSLVRRGYLSESGSNGYKLTYKGSQELVTFLNKDKNQAFDIISQALIGFLKIERTQAQLLGYSTIN